MDEATRAVIQKYESQLAPILEEMAPLVVKANKIKDRINGLYELEGEEIPYPEALASASTTNQAANNSRTFSIPREDYFYGRPLATVVKEILVWRGAQNLGAIPIDDLFDLMKQGGYGFEGKDDATKKRILASAIGKNVLFARVPNTGNIGLAEWYGIKRRPRNAATITTVLQNGQEIVRDASEVLSSSEFPLGDEKPQNS